MRSADVTERNMLGIIYVRSELHHERVRYHFFDENRAGNRDLLLFKKRGGRKEDHTASARKVNLL